MTNTNDRLGSYQATPPSDRRDPYGAGRHRGRRHRPRLWGLFGTKALRRADVDITMIAKTTYPLFQPLLYQVATGILSEGEVAPPTREILAS